MRHSNKATIVFCIIFANNKEKEKVYKKQRERKKEKSLFENRPDKFRIRLDMKVIYDVFLFIKR